MSGNQTLACRWCLRDFLLPQAALTMRKMGGLAIPELFDIQHRMVNIMLQLTIWLHLPPQVPISGTPWELA